MGTKAHARASARGKAKTARMLAQTSIHSRQGVHERRLAGGNRCAERGEGGGGRESGDAPLIVLPEIQANRHIAPSAPQTRAPTPPWRRRRSKHPLAQYRAGRASDQRPPALPRIAPPAPPGIRGRSTRPPQVHHGGVRVRRAARGRARGGAAGPEVTEGKALAVTQATDDRARATVRRRDGIEALVRRMSTDSASSLDRATNNSFVDGSRQSQISPSRVVLGLLPSAGEGAAAATSPVLVRARTPPARQWRPGLLSCRRRRPGNAVW
jgi:hypothetical protein